MTPVFMSHVDVGPLVNGAASPDGQFNVADFMLIQKKAADVINFWFLLICQAAKIYQLRPYLVHYVKCKAWAC